MEHNTTLIDDLVERNTTLVNAMTRRHDGITIRRATIHDNLKQMACLLYQSDPFIYPFWRKNQTDFAELVEPWMRTENFIFSYRNFYIAHRLGQDQDPLGILVIIDGRTPLDFDYGSLRQIDTRTAFIVDRYLQPLIDDVKWSGLLESAAHGLALSVEMTMRQQGIATDLLRCYCYDLYRHGVKTLKFNCLTNNRPARQLYDGLGCKIFDTGIGFDGTDHSKVDIVAYYVPTAHLMSI